MGEPAGNLGIARRYLQALERGETGDALKEFLAPDSVLEEERPGCGPGRGGTRQKGHVPADV